MGGGGGGGGVGVGWWGVGGVGAWVKGLQYKVFCWGVGSQDYKDRTAEGTGSRVQDFGFKLLGLILANYDIFL